MIEDVESIETNPIQSEANLILGPHPSEAHPFGILAADDTLTQSGIPHRALNEVKPFSRDAIVTYMRKKLLHHHVSLEMLEAMKHLGLEAEQSRMSSFPIDPSTRKGNLAEVFLAEYLISASNVDLPIYRLRYNTNPNQSMKGDDVLAFDLDSDPVRIIVGESKFRSTPSKRDVINIVDGLLRSYRGGIPVSLQFIAARLFDAGKEELATKVLNCSVLFAQEKLQLDYVGLLMGDLKSTQRINDHTDDSLHRLAMISFNINDPGSIIDQCFQNL